MILIGALMETEWTEWIKLQERLASVSANFLEAATKLDTNLREQVKVCGRWSPKDIVSHIVGWEREVARRFRMFLAGQTEDVEYDIDSFNAQSVASRRQLSWEQVIDELKAAQKELKGVNEAIRYENLTTESRFQEWVETLCRHYEHHMAQIQKFV